MRGELSRILTLVALGFLVVLYCFIEACVWLAQRLSEAERREEQSDDDGRTPA
jgi:hypothetical protein